MAAAPRTLRSNQELRQLRPSLRLAAVNQLQSEDDLLQRDLRSGGPRFHDRRAVRAEGRVRDPAMPLKPVPLITIAGTPSPRPPLSDLDRPLLSRHHQLRPERDRFFA